MVKASIKLNLKSLKYSMEIAADWLVESAQIKTECLKNLKNVKNKKKLAHNYWKGAIKGEYAFSEGIWSFFCPIWHTGQAVKSLIYAYNIFNEISYLNSALLGAEFIIRNSIRDKRDDDYGFIMAYEDNPQAANISAIFEGIDCFFELAELFKKWEERDKQSLKEYIIKSETINSIKKYEALNNFNEFENFGSISKYFENIAVSAVDWCVRKAFIKEEGLFWDQYDPFKKRVLGKDSRENTEFKGRPLSDDAVLLKAYLATNNKLYLDVFKTVLRRLKDDEYPKGNWIKWWPANEREGHIHPRHAYWWGLPFLIGYKILKEPDYLIIGTRSVEWYLKALRSDGGIFRDTYLDFNTPSFGQATSGAACANIMFYTLKMIIKNIEDAKDILKENNYNIDDLIMYLDEGINRSLNFCRTMQLNMPDDESLYGVLIEKILTPRGKEANPMYIRDLGTIFYIQAVGKLLEKKD